MCSSHNTHSIETPKNPNFGYPTHHYTLFWKHKAAHRVIILVFLYLLHIQEWKSNRFPKIITVFTSHFEMFVPFFFNQWVVLNGHGVPHKIFLRKNNQKNLKMWDLCTVDILFSSNHNIHKSSWSLCFRASDPLIERF